MEIRISFPDPEYTETFTAYSNYLIDLSEILSRLYGRDHNLIQNVFTTVTQHPPVQAITRRSLQPTEEDALERSLRKAWSHLRRAYREIENQQSFDEESNAWIPIQAYYAGYYSIIALSIASKRAVPKNHRKALNNISQEIQRGKLPYPWNAYCIGCPQTKTASFGGIEANNYPHVLSLPKPRYKYGSTSDVPTHY